MAKWQFDGLNEYVRKISGLGKDSEGYIKRAVYVGAGVVAKAVGSAIDALPEAREGYVPGDAPIRGITAAQKAGLKEGLGIAKMRNDAGYINTKIGFDGYNSVRTKKYPNGQPNALIARAVESGTSRRPKTQFITKAVRSVRDQAERYMADQFDKDLQKTMEE